MQAPMRGNLMTSEISIYQTKIPDMISSSRPKNSLKLWQINLAMTIARDHPLGFNQLYSQLPADRFQQIQHG